LDVPESNAGAGIVAVKNDDDRIFTADTLSDY